MNKTAVGKSKSKSDLDTDENTDEKEKSYPHAALLLTQDCSAIQLLDLHSRLPSGSDTRSISASLIGDCSTHPLPEDKIELAIENAESLGPFVRSLDFERCLDLPNYVRLPSSDSTLRYSLDLIALDAEGKNRLDALGPEAKETLNSSDLDLVGDLVAGDPKWKEFIDYLDAHWEKLLSFEGTKFVLDDLNEPTTFETGRLKRSWRRITPVSDRTMDEKQEVIKKMAASIKNVCTDFLWVESALKADFFSGNDTDMATRFPLSFVLEQAFDYPDKSTGFQVASKVMDAVSQLRKNSSVNSNYLFNQAVNSLLCKEKFWRQASPEWRDLLIKSDVFPIEELCPGNDHSHPLDRSPLFLACRFSPYASDVQALLEAGASPNQLCTLENNGCLCEWSAEIADDFSALGAVSCLMLKHSEIPQIEKKLDQFINHPLFTNIHKMGVPLHLAIFKRVPASMVEKLLQHPDCDVHWRPAWGMRLPGGRLTALELATQKALFDDHHSQDVSPSGQSDASGSTNGSIEHWAEVIQALARQGAGLDDKGQGRTQDINRLLETAQESYESAIDNDHDPSARALRARKRAIREAIQQGWAKKARKVDDTDEENPEISWKRCHIL